MIMSFFIDNITNIKKNSFPEIALIIIKGGLQLEYDCVGQITSMPLKEATDEILQWNRSSHARGSIIFVIDDKDSVNFL